MSEEPSQSFFSRIVNLFSSKEEIDKPSNSDQPSDEQIEELIQNVLSIKDSIVKEIMIPRVNISSITETNTLEEVYEIAKDTKHSRYPVFSSDSKKVIGILHVKDIEGKITIKQLLTHTSGLSHGLGENLYEKQLFKLMYNELFDPADYVKLEQRIEALFKAPLVSQPGEKWYYSASTDVLALILQRITKNPINRYLKENIFDLLEMNDTGYNVNLNNEERIMMVHLKNEEGELILSPTQVPIQGNTLYGGTHGLFSSIEDYLQFCRMILNNGKLNGKKILSKKSVKLMIKNHVQNFLGSSRGFGLGFGVLVDAEKESSPANDGQIYWGGYFKI